MASASTNRIGQRMSTDDLDRAYEEALKAARERGAVMDFPAERERRAYPRIRVSVESAESQKTDRPLHGYVIDVSASGAGVCVREPSRDGDCLHIYHGEEEPICMSVVNCRFSAFDHEALVTYYRLNCIAKDETAGKQLLVHLHQHGEQALRFVRP